MSSKWSTQVLGKNGTPNFGDLLKDEFTVILLQGKNVFGDMIYCYVKVALPDISKLQTALRSDDSFHPSDYGTVVAAGKGDPTDEVKAEIATTYNVLTNSKSAPAAGTIAPIPDEKKAWDEY